MNVKKLRWPSGQSVRFRNFKLGFDSESGQTNDAKIDIQRFPARHSALEGQCGQQAGKFTCVVPLGKALSGIPQS